MLQNGVGCTTNNSIVGTRRLAVLSSPTQPTNYATNCSSCSNSANCSNLANPNRPKGGPNPSPHSTNFPKRAAICPRPVLLPCPRHRPPLRPPHEWRPTSLRPHLHPKPKV